MSLSSVVAHQQGSMQAECQKEHRSEHYRKGRVEVLHSICVSDGPEEVDMLVLDMLQVALQEITASLRNLQLDNWKADTQNLSACL